MPKKWVGENSKAASAKVRKASARAEEEARRKAHEEDELWRDEDKNLAKKQQRKGDKERKRLEELAKKQEKQAILEEEGKKNEAASKQSAAKVSQAQIQAENEKRQAAALGLAAEEKQKRQTHLHQPLEENVNRLVLDGEEARSVSEAIALLSTSQSQPEDKHPERRLKAALAAFEEKRLPEIKAANPNLRMSQLKQILRKEWMKSPDNPVNQAIQSKHA